MAGAGGPSGPDEPAIESVTSLFLVWFGKISELYQHRRRLVILIVAGSLTFAMSIGFVIVNESSGEPDPLDRVPSGVDTVVMTDIGQAGDASSATGALTGRNVTLNLLFPSSPNRTAVLELPTARSDVVKVSDIEKVVDFRKGQAATPYRGAIVEAEWNVESVIDAYREQGIEYSRMDHAEGTLYRPPAGGQTPNRPWIGVLAPGTFAIGTEAAVKDAMAVSSGEQSPVAGTVRSSFHRTRRGFIRFATSLQHRDRIVPGEGADNFDGSPFNDIQTVAGVAFDEDDRLTLRVHLFGEDESAARRIEDRARAIIALADEVLSNETLASVLSDTDIQREGQVVTLELSRPAGDVDPIIIALRNITASGSNDRISGQMIERTTQTVSGGRG